MVAVRPVIQPLAVSVRNGGLKFPYQALLVSAKLSPTMKTLARLERSDQEKHDHLVLFINQMLALRDIAGAGIKLTLFLPSFQDLSEIDIDAILRDPEAYQQTVKKCYLPRERKIDLRPLVRINRVFAARREGNLAVPQRA
ncbi:MAG: hypothetical protein HQ564_01525 [Candidatus Saganbacteria bacterium]|nr:hypothetical protein [Candidatus Saganbacteria bacterium]